MFCLKSRVVERNAVGPKSECPATVVEIAFLTHSLVLQDFIFLDCTSLSDGAFAYCQCSNLFYTLKVKRGDDLFQALISSSR